MAKKYPDMRKGENRDLLTKVRDRYKTMYDADHENRTQAMDDMKFATVPGYQWDSNMKQERGKRPCYEFNKVRIKGKRIINGMRSNRPGVKVRGTEDGDKQGAEIREGLIRNIWEASDAETVVDYQADYQVHGGMGAWRVDTEYTADDAFEQDILIKGFENPYTVFCDPASKDFLKRDAADWCISTRMSKDEFEETWPGADKSSFQGDMQFDDEHHWEDDDMVRVAEYWYKTPTTKTLLKLQSGAVVDADSDEGLAILADPVQKEQVVDTREVETKKIQYCFASGQRILSGPHDWAGRQFPFVMVFGEYIVIDGKPQWYGLVRWAKDPQRSYNVSRTAITETIAQAPLSKFWATAKQGAGLTKQWSEAHKKNFPFMLYNPDPAVNGPPTRMGGADVPVALIQETQMADQELKDVMGVYDASLGQRSNESSGRAIFARQSEGEIVNFNFEDNMAKGVQRTYEILMDLIPEIYDTERELRVLGADGAEEYFKVNQVVRDPRTNQILKVHDLAAGKYDVTVTKGPSFTSKRQEAAEIYTQLVQQIPDIMGVAGDLIFKSMDIPYAEEIAERLRFMLPPAVQESLKKDMPPEVAAIMAQAEQAMQQAGMMMQEAQAAKQEAEAEQSKTREAKANVGTDAAKLEAKWAKFEKMVAEELRKLAEMKAEIAPILAGAADTSVAAGKVDDMKEVVDKLDQMVAQFMLEADQAVDEVANAADRRIVSGAISRKGGQLQADIQYDDGSTRQVTAQRDGDTLRLLPEDEKTLQ